MSYWDPNHPRACRRCGCTDEMKTLLHLLERPSMQRLVPRRPRACDLYCCAGGAAVGLYRAGFDVEGWDIRQNLSYPFSRHIGNALDADLSEFDFVWASPPCQAHSALRHLHPKKEYECFIKRTREKLKAWGGLYIIENVPGSPLINPVQLCGSAFGLKVRRHRLFESNVPLRGVECDHKTQGRPIDVSGTGGRRINRRENDHGGNTNKPRNIQEAQEAMGINWMCREELAQAIPPAYSEFLALQIMSVLKAGNEKADRPAGAKKVTKIWTVKETWQCSSGLNVKGAKPQRR